jgi:hypothetical protein
MAEFEEIFKELGKEVAAMATKEFKENAELIKTSMHNPLHDGHRFRQHVGRAIRWDVGH